MSRRLVLRQINPADATVASAYAAFLEHVFGAAPERPAYPDPAWTLFAVFDASGGCVAGIETAVLRFVADGCPLEAAAIRLAGVAEAHRGRGLFRDLMTQALAWCTAQCDGPILLYTETPALYGRFGFRPLAQHAFVGAAPADAPRGKVELVERDGAARLIDRLAPARAAISNLCAIVGAADLLRASLRGDSDLRTAYAADLDALVVYEIEGETLVLVDVVAAAMPSLARIVGALRPRCTRVRVLFPPDRLDWSGAPELDDTGLMIRGRVPAAMTRPFMLPPTTSF